MPAQALVETKPIYKTINAVVKGADKDTGIVDILIPLSTESVDRDGESILPAAFKKRLKAFKAHPVLLSSHDYMNLQKQIGEWTSIKVTEDGLVGKPKYYVNMGNPEADWGFFLASIGMASYSVGFIPFAWDDAEEGDGDKTPRRIYTDVELLEVSHVVIPSNRDAAQTMRSVLANKGIEIPKAMDTALQKMADPEPLFIAGTNSEQAEKGKVKNLVDDLANAEIIDNTGEEPFVMKPKARAISQEELKDELDYCLSLVELVGISDITRETAMKLHETIKRIVGSDIPIDDIKQAEPIKAVVKPEPPQDKLGDLASLRELYRQYGQLK